MGANGQDIPRPRYRRLTTRVSSIVSASWLSWKSSCVSRSRIVQLLLETCGKTEMPPVDPNQDIVMKAPENASFFVGKAFFAGNTVCLCL